MPYESLTGSQRRLGIALAALLVTTAGALLSACGDEDLTCPTGKFRCVNVCLPEPVPTLTYIQEEIFDRQCNIQQCHGQPESVVAEDLRLYDAATSYDQLVGRESIQRAGAILVTAGSAAESYLVNKMTGVDMEARSSDGEPTEIMPNGPGTLCVEQLDTIVQWIDSGAPQN